MRKISEKSIIKKVAELAIQANTRLRNDVSVVLKRALHGEKKSLARKALEAILKNAEIASKEKLAICQDTGLPVVFVEIGNNVQVNGEIADIINKGIERGYREGCLRASVQKDPLLRNTKLSFTPAIVHVDILKGSKLKITVFPKGFGSENKSKVKMLSPTASLKEIEDFVIESVQAAGSEACPPYFIGLGIGGTQDTASLLAKKALLRPVTKANRNKKIANMEKHLLNKINKLNIGPFGFGGKNTALALSIETFPTHIAGLPVAVNISCHALRSASVTI